MVSLRWRAAFSVLTLVLLLHCFSVEPFSLPTCTTERGIKPIQFKTQRTTSKSALALSYGRTPIRTRLSMSSTPSEGTTNGQQQQEQQHGEGQDNEEEQPSTSLRDTVAKMVETETEVVPGTEQDVPSVPTPTTSNGTSNSIMEPYDDIPLRFGPEAYVLTQAAVIGILSGWSVGAFKLSIDAVRQFTYGSSVLPQYMFPLIPAAGGLAVGLLALMGKFPPGLLGTAKEVDQDCRQDMSALRLLTRPIAFLRKTAAAVLTLGTGCSLGPEGPAVEVGMAVSRLCMTEFPMESFVRPSTEGSQEQAIVKRIQRNRLLLSCGAAAGVSAGFSAPIAGVFFALEIVQRAFQKNNREERLESINDSSTSTSLSSTVASQPPLESYMTSSSNVSAILLSSVLSALIAQALLGSHLVLELSSYSLKTPLIELPLYLLLGGLSGVVATAFTQTSRFFQGLFAGTTGPKPVRNFFDRLPPIGKPILGGLLCGIIGMRFPQILFFGYETLNGLLANSSLPTSMLLSLLVVKTATTALSAGSGLVGGTFAPSLFLGGMLGGSFHNVMVKLFTSVYMSDQLLQLADVPAYAMVGAACVLSALFRAPLTAALLLFELTQDYQIILPLLASAGVASLVGDILEDKLARKSM